MKKLCIIIACMCVSMVCRAQFTSPMYNDQRAWSVGLDKNTSVYVNHSWMSGFHTAFKHTVIADKVEYQSYRLDGGYLWSNPYVNIDASPFFTGDWKMSFWNVGLQLSAVNQWKSEYFRCGIKYIPYYDSELRMQHGWAVGLEANVSKDVSLIMEYGRTPEYRIAYNRLYAGVVFKVFNLMVKPMFEMPIYDTGIHPSHGKVVVSLSYGFGKTLVKKQ